MKKYALLILVFVFLIALVGCSTHNDKNSNTVNEYSESNELFPSFEIENVSVKKGEKDVIVKVSVKDNPGFLTMAMNIEYNSDIMTLKSTKNGADYSDYNFVGPKNMQNGCTASWFIPELPEKINDGIILELIFDISDKADSGSYPISVSRPDNGGIVDKNQEEIIFNNATGYIEIK